MTDWNPILPPASIWFGAIALGVLTLLAAWRTRGTWPWWANLSSIGLRAIALVCAMILALRPETVRREKLERRPPLAVLVDATQSLNLRDEDRAPTRAEAGRPALAALLQGAAQREWEVLAFDAGSRLVERAPADTGLRARAPESPLGEMLAETAERTLDRPGALPPAAVVLFSDGCVNRGRPLADAARVFEQRGVPLYAVTLGLDRPLPPDAVIGQPAVRREENREGSAPRAGERLIVEARAYLAAEGPELTGPLADTITRLSVSGPPGGLPGTREGERGYVEAGALRHRLRSEPGWTPVRMDFVAKEPGLYRIRVALDALENERRMDNNVAFASVEVLPPKRRVLFAASRLGHDYRKLKALFAAWDGPETETLADFVRPQRGSENPEAEWPLEAALARQLDERVAPAARAGTLIWAEPNPAHLSARSQAALRAALEAGDLGIVWVLNEPIAEAARRFRGTPLEEALLFQGFSVAGAAPPGEIAPAAVRATEAARDHPVTRFAFRSGAPADPFAVLGPTRAWGPLGDPREGTTVLLSAGHAPLLCTGVVGRGRVALLACGESWRWLSPSAQSYEQREVLAAELWRSLVEWISGSGSRHEPPVRLYLPKDRWDLGETLSVRVAVRAPQQGEPVRVKYALRPAPAAPGPLPDQAWKDLAGDTGVSRMAEDRLGAGALRVLAGAAGTPGKAGEWLLEVKALRPTGDEIGTDRAHLVVRGSTLEERGLRPDFAGLQAAAQVAGGRALKPDEKAIAALLSELDARMRPEVSERVERLPAVSPAALLVLLIFALFVDVWLRRG